MNPIAIGPTPGRRQSTPTTASDPVTLLQQILSVLQTLQARLAPVPEWVTTVTFDGTSTNAGAGVSQVISPTGPYNAILVGLSAGIVDIYFGGSKANVYDFQLTPVSNGVLIPFPIRQDTQVMLLVDSTSASAAFGKIYFIRY